MSGKKKNEHKKRHSEANANHVATKQETKVPLAKTDNAQKTTGIGVSINTPDLFETFGKKTHYIAFGLLLLIAFIVFKDYILFDKVYFFKDIGSDSYNYNYPRNYFNASYIAQHGLPKWSFNYGIGQSLFPFVLQDPSDIIFYIVGKDHYLYGKIFAELLKIILGGMFFFYYLRELKLSSFTAVAGCIMFAFCGFVIVGSGWYIYPFEACNLALLLLAFERLLNGKSLYLFVIGIFLIGISQPFNLYLYGFFLALYAVLRLLQNGEFNIRRIGIVLGRMIGLGLLGLLISAPFLIENIVQMLESPRGSGKFSYAHTLSSLPMFDISDSIQLGTCVLRFFSSEILGSGNDFKGWMNILEAPLFYCGIPCLVLMPQIFNFLNKKQRIAFIVFISLWVIPIMFPYFRRAFWLFSGDYYRAYSFFVALAFLYLSVLALDYIFEERKVNLIVLIATVVILLILLNYPFFPDKEIVNSAISFYAGFMVVVYAVILFLVSRVKNLLYIRYIFLLALVFELSYLSGISVNNRDAVTTAELSQRTGYNDFTKDALSDISSHDKSFYRIDKSYASSPAMHFSLNDAFVQNYRGTSCYSSFNHLNYINYLSLMGLIDTTSEVQSRWAPGFITRHVLESENSVKYILTKQMNYPMWRVLCDSLTKFGNTIVLRNKYALPFGYCYGSYIKESIFRKISNAQKDFVSLRACVVKDIDAGKCIGMKEFSLTDTVSVNSFTPDVYMQYVNDLRKDTLTIDKFEDVLISAKTNLSTNKMLYLSMPLDAGWSATVDGKDVEMIKLSAGMTGLMLQQGVHTILLKYELRFFYKGLYLSLIGIIILGILMFLSMRKVHSKSLSENT